jgi:tetratricopeptide (TPR) repeat protein
MLRRIGWLAVVGLVLLFGFFVFRKHRPQIGSGSALVGGTNRPGAALNRQAEGTADDLNSQAARLLNAGDARQAIQPPIGSDSALAGRTNRPGAVLSRQAEGTADDLNNQGARLLDAGEARQAIQIFEQALALTPENETFHFNLGLAFTRAGDLTNAEHEYREALRLLPDYPEAHNNYGNLLARSGRLAEAEEHLSEAVKQLPESAPFNNSLGVLRQRLNETNEALLCFQKAVECDSNYLEAHFNLAQAYLARKNLEKGIAELRETLRIKPGFEPAQRALARATGQESSNAPTGAATPR